MYMIKDIVPGVYLVAKGRASSVSRSLVIAEADIYTVYENKLVTSGSRTFMKGPVKLEDIRIKLSGAGE
jgi:acyl-coenzyme A thioesterase PaaI-like protein